MEEIKVLLNLSTNYIEKFFQDNVIDKNEYESLCNIFY